MNVPQFESGLDGPSEALALNQLLENLLRSVGALLL